MRVITGTARGRKLSTPTNYDIRPTTDNVKESIFNIIQFDIEGRKVLDLFAGTGQLGIECLSRGAESVTFVDENKEAIRIIKENLKNCQLKGTVIQGDAVSFLRNCGKFDLIFIDPPYDSKLYEPVLELINSVDILSDGGIIVCEARKEKLLPEMNLPYKKRKEYSYGKLEVCTYIKESD
ncbi:MAG: 16S rRNA (guanine(966)-N(2))-methyltransferase RsmD [Oscillospiraceae bacterium]|nr:16S rRNA (guanine(966)-N(2))-methyltransferase RsmD [Oscillospiraceae bacterium]